MIRYFQLSCQTIKYVFMKLKQKQGRLTIENDGERETSLEKFFYGQNCGA